ncbi:K(+)-transporting ATPase subunit C [Corynebacterium auriscanis]|uniref:K(+)-transporting ATPase subunit C n=1 Tax=Corynebacterium auriscanis TaxID=99807 RepID=UPI0025B45FFD|nr:K(+)-transporting ATPase subunit C [Corynebacterium auriscanis]WJY72965.1 Potassium-transporting ATPase C chain [Corynebacterium auriscanis]
MAKAPSGNGLRLASTTVRIFFLLTLILGIVYPIAMVGVGRIMPAKTDGSMITNSQGEPAGSTLIAQEVTAPGFFYPRPSAAGDDGFDAMSSSATNLSPSSKDLQAAIAKQRDEVAARENVSPNDVPVDAVTSSGSGLDPHISTRYAQLQAPRVAKERGIDKARVDQLIADATEGNFTGNRDGAPVNVVKLNKALSDMS